MNKCDFCEKSIPTGSIGGWKCSCESSFSYDREPKCLKALKTMEEYNKARAKSEGNNSEFC